VKSLQIVIKSVPFSLKLRNKYHAWTDETNANILQPYPVVAADVLLEICKAVISVLLSFDEHLSQTNSSCVRKFCLQSVHCCLIRNIFLGVRIAKRFTKSNKRFWWDVKFKNEPALCSWIHHIRICTNCTAGVSSGLVTKCHSNVTRGEWGVYCSGVNLLPI
jgi:hypothetical protein